MQSIRLRVVMSVIFASIIAGAVFVETRASERTYHRVRHALHTICHQRHTFPSPGTFGAHAYRSAYASSRLMRALCIRCLGIYGALVVLSFAIFAFGLRVPLAVAIAVFCASVVVLGVEKLFFPSAVWYVKFAVGVFSGAGVSLLFTQGVFTLCDEDIKR